MFLINCMKQVETKYPSTTSYFYALTANLMITSVHFTYKTQVRNFPYFQFIQIFSLYTTILNSLYIYFTKLPSLWTTVKTNKLLIWRGFIGASNALIMYIGIRLLPFSEGIVIANVVPSIVGVMAVFVLNEPLTKSLIISSIFSLVGVILVAKPPFIFSEQGSYENYPYRFWGIIVMIGYVITNSALRIIMRAIGKDVSPWTTTFYWCICMSSMAPLLEMEISGVQSERLFHHVIGALLSVLNLLGMVLSTKAFSLGKAGNVALMSYMQIVFAYIADIVFEGNEVDHLSLMGSIMIFSCMIINIYFGR